MAVLLVSFDYVFAAPLRQDQRKIGALDAPTGGEQLGNLSAGFDGIQRRPSLNAETLASFGATSGENGAAALGGHASTEAVALGALASVRLVSAFHFPCPFHVQRVTSKVYITKTACQ